MLNQKFKYLYVRVTVHTENCTNVRTRTVEQLTLVCIS